MSSSQTVFDTGNVDDTSQTAGGAAPSALTCLQACEQCHDTCRAAAFGISPAAAQELGADEVRLLLECAELCQLSANWQLAGSRNGGQICAVCAKVCRQCQERCAEIDGMQPCAAACQRCAESCESMGAMA